MKKSFTVLIVLAILCSTFAGAAFAQGIDPVDPLFSAPSDETGEMVDETPGLWFVELTSPPTADGTSLSVVQKEKQNFRNEAAKARLNYSERYAFNTLWNGLSISLPAGQLSKLTRLSSVKAIYPVQAVPIPQTTEISEPDLFTALSMTGADVAQSELGFTGKGVKVAVMDTGLDYDHPDLGGAGNAQLDSPEFPNARVVAGWDFVGNDYNADPASPSYDPVPHPDAYPDDCNGHGTHVAGIIGANGTVKGVAPDVTFGAYRVFGCEGSTEDDVMIAAMERALADGMQVLNMSIGSAFTWPQYPTAQASDRLVNKGMVVVASIGNSGANGLYSAGAPGLGNKVIGVASFDNIAVMLNYFTASPDNTKIGYTPATAAPLPPTAGTDILARTGTQTSPADACNALPSGSLVGKVALIRRGTCPFYQKAYNAQSAGASGVVLYNNATGRINPTVAGSPAITIPVVAVSDTEGKLLDTRLAAGPVTITWTDQLDSFPNTTTGNLISSFSSYGLSPDLALKPDLGAPGGYIYSTYPLELGGYANLSGTSMASPHVAGAVALLLQARPNTSSQAVRGILQNSADPKPWWGNPGLGFLDNVSRQGAGMLKIDAAILSTTKIEPAKLSLGESQAGPQTYTLSLENKAKTAVTYDLSSVNALSVGNTFTPAFSTSDATVDFSSPTVTVPAKSKATVSVTVYPPSGPDKAQYGGYIVFTPQGGGQIYRVPFGGFVGDYQSIQVLKPTPYGFPWLGVLYEGSYYQNPGDWVYTMAGDDIPFFLVHLDHQAQLFKMTVKDALTGKDWKVAYQEEYLPRNNTSTGFFAFSWDGMTYAGSKAYTVPNGQYIVTISILKALGDPNTPSDWETWTSPVVTIARP